MGFFTKRHDARTENAAPQDDLDPVEGVIMRDPLPERVRRAFEIQPPSETEARALAALMDHPGATVRELSAHCGWYGSMWHTHLAALSWKRRDTLSPGAEGALLYGTLAEYDPGHARFTMKQEVAEALRALGIGH